MQNRVLCSETTYSSKVTLRPKSPAPVLEWGGQGFFRNLLCQTRIRRLSRPPQRPRCDAGHGVGITVSHALPQPCHAWGGAQGTAGAPARSPRPPGEGFGVAVRGKGHRSRGAGPPAGSAAPSHWTGGRGAAPRCGWGSRTRTPECIWKGRVDRQVEMCALDLSCDEAARNKPTLSLDARG